MKKWTLNNFSREKLYKKSDITQLDYSFCSIQYNLSISLLENKI